MIILHYNNVGQTTAHKGLVTRRRSDTTTTRYTAALVYTTLPQLVTPAHSCTLHYHNSLHWRTRVHFANITLRNKAHNNAMKTYNIIHYSVVHKIHISSKNYFYLQLTNTLQKRARAMTCVCIRIQMLCLVIK